MIVGLVLPDELARVRIDCVDPGDKVAEVDARRAVTRAGGGEGLLHDRGAHFRTGTVRPADAPGVEVERVHGSVLAADVDGAVGDRGLRARAQGAGKRERPLEFQPGQVCGGEAGRHARCEAGVAGRKSPASSGGFPPRVEVRGLPRAAWSLRVRPDVAPEVARHQAALVGGQARGLRPHHALIHRGLDGVRGHHLQEHLVRRLGHLSQVTARAVSLEERLAGVWRAGLVRERRIVDRRDLRNRRGLRGLHRERRQHRQREDRQRHDSIHALSPDCISPACGNLDGVARLKADPGA